MLDYDTQKPRHSPWSQLAILLFLFGVGMLIGIVVTVVVAQSYLHVPFQQLSDALKNSDNTNLSRVLELINAFFMIALPAFLYARIMNYKPFTFIGFNNTISGKQVFIIVGIVLFSIMISGGLSTLNEMIPISKSLARYFREKENEYNKEMLAIANMKTIQDYIVSLIMIALLPAIFEEMLFRGSLQPIMISFTKNAFAGILLTSILFSAIHMSYYGFFPRLALGLIIGYIFYFSKNLWLSSITHFLYNAFGVTQLYALSKQGLLTQDALKDDGFPLYYGLIAAGALYVLFIFFKRESEVVISMHDMEKNFGNN